MNASLGRVVGLIGVGAALIGGTALANRALLRDDLPPTLPGATHDWIWRGWRVRYTTMGDGQPIVLVHGVHAAASSFEMRNIFEPLSHRSTVYAIDLLGFGKSERPSAPYSGALYASLIGDFLAQIVGQPAVVVGSSLSAAYAVTVAQYRPNLVERLILVSPTWTTSLGLVGRASGHVLRLPLVGTAAFHLLVSGTSIKTYLRRVYADPSSVDDSLVGQHWATAHLPNARLAPAAFVAGRLDLPLPRGSVSITAPILVLCGSVPGIGALASDAELRDLGPCVTVETIPGAGQLPHDEAPHRILEVVGSWLG